MSGNGIWSSSMANLVNLAVLSAQESTESIQHGAVLFSSHHQVYSIGHNDMGHRICGYDVPSLHAEAICLKTIYDRVARLGQCYQGN